MLAGDFSIAIPEKVLPPISIEGLSSSSETFFRSPLSLILLTILNRRLFNEITGVFHIVVCGLRNKVTTVVTAWSLQFDD